MTKNKLNLLIIFIIAAFVWHFPKPEGLTLQGWHLLIVFVATIISIIVKPLPLSAVILLSLTVGTFTGVFTMENALNAYGKPTVWLVLLAFFIAKALNATGLGKRVAYLILSVFGKSPMGLSYSFVLTDLVLSPAIPSNTARGAGIIYPIIRSLTEVFDGKRIYPDQKGALGPFLIMVAFQANIITSAMFLTAISGNPFAADFAALQGIELSWGNWALAGCLPGLLCLILVPPLIYVFLKPNKLETMDARKIAKEELAKMGPLDLPQKILSVVFLGLLGLWAAGSAYGINATLAAMAGIVVLILTNVVSWDDLVSEKSAWNTFIWFGALIMYAVEIGKSGVISWFGLQVSDMVSSYDALTAFAIITLVYFYTHYFFASTTALISSMFGVFLSVLISKGIGGFHAAMTLAAFGSLSACITHYGTGSAPVYFGGGYLSVKTWWKIGFYLSLVYIPIWWFVGIFWWKSVGFGPLLNG